MRASVKERRKTDDFLNEFDASVQRMEDYVRALEAETKERANLINLLEQGDLFYEIQRGEFKVVCLVNKYIFLKIVKFIMLTFLFCNRPTKTTVVE